MIYNFLNSDQCAGKQARSSRLVLESLEDRRLLAADVVSLSPEDEASKVAEGTNLVLTFGEDVRTGPGLETFWSVIPTPEL